MAKQMSGEKPRFGAIRGYADGGRVEPPPTSFRGLFNTAKSAINNAMAPETAEQGQARRAAEYEAKKAKYGGQPAAPAAPAQPTGVSLGLDGSGGNSVDRRMKEAGFANGGQVKGIAVDKTMGAGRSGGGGFSGVPTEKTMGSGPSGGGGFIGEPVEKPIGAYRRGGKVAQKKSVEPVAKRKAPKEEPEGDEYDGSMIPPDQDGDEGMKLQGPGTATSDSIDAQVVETGEPIRVANGERILSVDQERYMQGVAKQMGHPSVDAMLEQGTGKPVGPTVKYVPQKAARGATRRRAAAGGMEVNSRSSDYENKLQQGDPVARVGQMQYQDNALNNQPQVVQRSGMGLPGYNPAMQGQTVSVPGMGGNADPIEEPVPTFACGGKVKGYAGGGAIELDPAVTGYGPNTPEGMDARQRAYERDLAAARVLAEQNAAKGALRDPVVAPAAAPVAQAPSVPGDGTMPYGEQMRRLGSALAGAPIEAIKTIVSAPGYGLSKDKAPAPTASTAPAAPAPATPTATTAGPAAVSPTYPDEQKRAPAVNVPAPAGAVRKVTDVGNGVTRIDQPGASPLFTNLEGGADNASNVALMNRQPMTAQNQQALDNLTAKYEAQTRGAILADQYKQQVAGAQRYNDWAEKFAAEQSRKYDDSIARKNAETTLSTKFGRPEEKAAASKLLDSLNIGQREAAARADGAAGAAENRAIQSRTLDMQQRNYDAQDQERHARGAIDRSKLAIDQAREGREAGTYTQQQAQRAKMDALQTAYEKETDPGKRAVLLENIRALSPNAGHAKDNFLVVGGGQEWDDTAKMMRTMPQRLIDVRTGQEVGGHQKAAQVATPTSKADYDALPKGATYIKNGVTYTKG